MTFMCLIFVIIYWNYCHVAEVWMDEYKEDLYKRRQNYHNIDMGDISKQN
jgi:hypothetical protein